MAGKLVFLTGGTGYLGKHLVPALLSHNYSIRLLARETSDVSWLPQGDIEVVRGDVIERDSVLSGVKGCDYVIHAAANFRFWGSGDEFTRVNMGGTKNVVEAAIKHRIKRYIHISTIAVVGQPPKNDPIDEQTLCLPQDDYQRSKLSAEQYVQELAKAGALPAVILRPGAFYGPGSTYGFNRLFVVEPMLNWRIKVEGGKRITFPAYLPDVADAVCRALSLGKVGEIYNISGQSYSHQAVNDHVSRILGIRPWRLSVSRGIMVVMASILELVARVNRNEPFYPLNLRYYVFNDWLVSSEKAKADLGFQATSLEDGLEATIEWIKKEVTK